MGTSLVFVPYLPPSRLTGKDDELVARPSSPRSWAVDEESVDGAVADTSERR
jgi:hypothetical protein